MVNIVATERFAKSNKKIGSQDQELLLNLERLALSVECSASWHFTPRYVY